MEGCTAHAIYRELKCAAVCCPPILLREGSGPPEELRPELRIAMICGFTSSKNTSRPAGCREGSSARSSFSVRNAPVPGGVDGELLVLNIAKNQRLMVYVKIRRVSGNQFIYAQLLFSF